jgi:D-alanyl-D-alanine dipeptidase
MTPDLIHLKSRVLPSSAAAQTRKRGYRQDVPIAGDGALASEPCVEATAFGLAGVNHYNMPFNPPYHEPIPGSIAGLFIRQSVGEKLLALNTRLASAGLEVYLFDAWRPQAVQRHFHDVWFPAWLRQRAPHLDGQGLVDEVEKYWAAPSAGDASPSPHSTGGAVDLTLRFRATGQPLFMGGLFDDVTEDAWTDAFEQKPIVSMSDEEARANRRLLYWVMAEAGFANNPTEWWHYSWGDQMWAKLCGEPAALYGACDPTDSAGNSQP